LNDVLGLCNQEDPFATNSPLPLFPGEELKIIFRFHLIGY